MCHLLVNEKNLRRLSALVCSISISATVYTFPYPDTVQEHVDTFSAIPRVDRKRIER